MKKKFQQKIPKKKIKNHQINIIKKDVLFDGLPDEIEVGRYHSWVVDPNLPDELVATSVDQNGQLMSLRHKEYDVSAVQFHPESVLTPHGKQILENWLNKKSQS